MAIETRRLKILDITNYLSPGTSYSAYLKAFHVKEKKGYFPYEYITNFDQLYETELPPYEKFYSKLNGKNPLDEGESPDAGRKRWNELQTLWQTAKMPNILALLEWYNNLDTSSFVQAAQTQCAFFRENMGIDILKDAISLPGVSLKFAMKTTDAKFCLYGEKYKWVYKLFREAVVGGPSIVFCRKHEKNVTKIRETQFGSKAQLCKGVIGVDASSLYLHSFSQDFPAGNFVVRHPPHFEPEPQPRHGYSQAAINWIESEARERGVTIVHALNSNGEIEIGARKLKVDGFLADENAIWEFHGCYYHGCSKCYGGKKKDEPHPYYPPKTFGDVRERTRKKIEYFQQLGYVVHEKWECEWREQNPLPPAGPRKLSQAQIIDMIRDGTLYGFVRVDIRTPEHLKAKMAEFPPIFKNCEVGREDIGDYMRNYCERVNVLRKPVRMLISSYHANRTLMLTTLLKFYLEIGLEITKVHLVVEFPDHRPCFQEFADRVCDARRKGDQDPDSDILANTMKLVGNSSYGKFTMDKSKQTNTVFANEARAVQLFNYERFKTCHALGGGLFQIELYKTKHVQDLALHAGLATYMLAKLRMLQWEYSFMQKYLAPNMYELIQMDTDSSYFAIARDTLEQCVRPEMKREFFLEFDHWFPTLACQKHKLDFVNDKMAGRPWVMRPCCKEANDYHKRTPGKFKIEFEGDGAIALCSKTYLCYGQKEIKLSCKGLQKKRNFERLTKQTYLDVLETQTPGQGTNKGFRAMNGKVYTYSQKRRGLSFLYCKRKLLEDGISTEPLLL